MSSSSEILIVGAGVLGLSLAAELALRGRAVTVVDPGETNASAVAAGMIAPALESAIENVTPQRASLFKAARDLWPEFARRTGVILHREGAVWRGPNAADMADRLESLGFEVRRSPGEVFTPDDWRVEPAAAMDALAATPGVVVRRGRVRDVASDGGLWRAGLLDGGTLTARTLILATGHAAGIAGLPLSAVGILEQIRPIRGQLEYLPWAAPPQAVRGRGAYAAPAVGGMVVGASMDADRADTDPDPAQTESLMRAAHDLGVLSPSGEGVTRVGVRGASPDGLPIAGLLEQGLGVALAPRRNGWLLAPAVARTVADSLEGAAPSAFASPFDPRRLRDPVDGDRLLGFR